MGIKNYLINMQKDAKENEEQFQKSYNEWKKTNSECAWKSMYLSVYIACLNICKKIYTTRKIIIEDEELVSKAVDSANYTMRFIKEKNVHPEKLSSYCYLRCLKYIQMPKEVWYEKNVSQMPFYNNKEIELEDYNE